MMCCFEAVSLDRQSESGRRRVAFCRPERTTGLDRAVSDGNDRQWQGPLVCHGHAVRGFAGPGRRDLSSINPFPDRGLS